MRIRCRPLLGPEIVTARLVETPSMLSRGDTTVVLELDDAAPLQLSPPDASGAEVIEATTEEWERLVEHGFELPRAADAPSVCN